MNIESVPGQFRYLVNKCTQVDSQDRFSTVDALRDSFYAVADPSQFHHVGYAESGTDIFAADTFSVETADAICRQLVENLENDDLLRRDFPKVSTLYLSHFVNERLEEFKTILRAFDNHVSGRLDFSYCDSVADVYVRIRKLTNDLDIFRLIATRLLLMGARHNRFKVMNDFCNLIRDIGTEEQGKAMIAAEVIKAYPSEFDVVDHEESARLDNAPLPRIIRGSIDQVRGLV